MKKVMSGLLGLIPILVLGYFFLPNLNGNSDAMLKYLEETNKFTITFNEVVDGEWAVETEEDLLVYTEEVSIPTMEQLLKDSEQYGTQIKKDKLKAVHDIHNEAVKKRIEADKAWMNGSFTESESLYNESDELYMEYEEELEKLANKWAVDIEWEGME